MPKPFIIEDDTGLELHLPTQWEICPTCDGEGQHSRAVDGNGITASEWNGPEWDEDSRALYLSGGYDQRCDECHGDGKIAVVDESRLTPDQLEWWTRWIESERQYHAIRAAERRMGA